MPGQYLLPYNPGPTGRLTSGLVSYVQDHPLWTAARRWPFALAHRLRMHQDGISRLLAAVHTDIVGYSRLFALDDIGTVARLRDLRRTLFAPAIRQHRGHLVQTAGDSMLITFDSVIQAVRCAVAFQDELLARNQSWSPDLQIRLRIGVDLGDIIADGTDFHGDGVIVAARLQAQCPPGGVCVSRAVHDRGADRLGLTLEALGPLWLKNLERPVEAFVLWPSAGLVQADRTMAPP
jgi:class 3 adenylate cyclase